MKVYELIGQLMRMPPDLDIYAIHDNSGASHDVCAPFAREKRACDDIGPLCDVADGTQIVVLPVDN